MVEHDADHGRKWQLLAACRMTLENAHDVAQQAQGQQGIHSALVLEEEVNQCALT